MLGSVIQGIFGFLTARQDTVKQIDNNDVAVVQSRNQVIIATKDDLGLRLLRYFACIFPLGWVNTYIWDRWAEISHPNWVWGVKTLDLPWENYLPVMAVYAFLLGLAWRGK